MNNATFYPWKAKYGGLDASQLKQPKYLQDENSNQRSIQAARVPYMRWSLGVDRCCAALRSNARNGGQRLCLRCGRLPKPRVVPRNQTLVL
jgi:hypothetical protein